MLSRRALTRTSVGNKKYEYEDDHDVLNLRNLTRAHERGNQRKLALGGRELGGVALRHGPDAKRCASELSTLL